MSTNTPTYIRLWRNPLDQTGGLPESVVFRGYLAFHVSRVKAPRHDVYVGQRRQLLLRHIGLDRGEGLVSHHFFIGRRRHGLLHILGGHRFLGHDQITTERCAGKYCQEEGGMVKGKDPNSKVCTNGKSLSKWQPKFGTTWRSLLAHIRVLFKCIQYNRGYLTYYVRSIKVDRGINTCTVKWSGNRRAE